MSETPMQAGRLPAVEIETGPHPVASIIWLHGLGADGNDFVPIVPELGLDAALPVRYVFPHAPQMPVTINGGWVMRAWYDIRHGDLSQREDEAGVRRSADLIEALIAGEVTRGVPSDHIVLAGFSQGCAMTLFAGLRSPHRLAGLVGLSGYLPVPDTLADERHEANRHTPVFLAHGRGDAVVPWARGHAAFERLQSLGQPVQWHDYPMGHEVDPDEIDDIGHWLRERLAACTTGRP